MTLYDLRCHKFLDEKKNEFLSAAERRQCLAAVNTCLLILEALIGTHFYMNAKHDDVVMRKETRMHFCLQSEILMIYNINTQRLQNSC